MFPQYDFQLNFYLKYLNEVSYTHFKLHTYKFTRAALHDSQLKIMLIYLLLGVGAANQFSLSAIIHLSFLPPSFKQTCV